MYCGGNNSNRGSVDRIDSVLDLIDVFFLIQRQLAELISLLSIDLVKLKTNDFENR